MTGVIDKSVTRNDYQDQVQPVIWHFMLPSLVGGGGGILSAYGTQARDYQLTQTLYQSTMWAAAVGIAIAKMASQDWTVEADVPLRAKRFQELILAVDNNGGWVNFVTKHLLNYILTNNGSFVEIIREKKGPSSKIVGLKHLDTLRSYRTGNLDVPVIYQDREGSYHELRDYQVFCFADMPDPTETFYGMGHCAAERAYDAILRVEAVERYMREKITGKRPLSIYIVNGLPDKKLQMAMEQARRDSESKGLMTYMGAAVVNINDPQAKPGMVEIPLASLPDGFDRKVELDIALLEFANALGIDPQDLQPLTGQSLGSGAQSQVLADKAHGKGLMTWRKAWIHSVNEFVLPDATTFAFSENDLRDQQLQASIFSTVGAAVGALVTSQVLSPAEGKQVLVDKEQIDAAYLPKDVTPDDDLADEEKPEGDAEAVEVPESEPVAEEVMPEQEVKNATKREWKPGKLTNRPPKHDAIRLLLDRSRREARKIARKGGAYVKKANTEGLPSSIASIIADLSNRIRKLMEQLQGGLITVDQWQRAMSQHLVDYGTAAALAGKDTEELSPLDYERLGKWTEVQLDYLQGFATEIQDAEEFMEGWNARADQYAASIKNPYWEARVDVLPLPAMPAQGTQCMNNCLCQWRIDPIDEENGDYDCYWELEEGAQHCQTCLERSEQWNPIRIRGMVLA